jgi:hypothetical protein
MDENPQVEARLYGNGRRARIIITAGSRVYGGTGMPTPAANEAVKKLLLLIDSQNVNERHAE